MPGVDMHVWVLARVGMVVDVRACVRACMRACVRECVRACVRAYVRDKMRRGKTRGQGYACDGVRVKMHVRRCA